MIELIKHVVELNYRNRALHPDYMSSVAYSREFKTIHLNIGRGAGKTTVIESLARPSDCLIVHNCRTMETLRRYRKFVCPINTIEGVILSANTLRGPIVKKYNWVWIDEPNLCDDMADINRIYEIIDADLFIMLGE